MSFLNKACIGGNVGKDPEVRRLTSGAPVVSLSLATSDVWRDKQTGERKEKTEWHRVVIFNEHIAKVAEQYVKKGSTIYIEGKLATRKWTDKDGVERYSTEIVLENFGGLLKLIKTPDGGERQGTSNGVRQDAPATFNRDEMDDEIPF